MTLIICQTILFSNSGCIIMMKMNTYCELDWCIIMLILVFLFDDLPCCCLPDYTDKGIFQIVIIVFAPNTIEYSRSI